MIKKVISGGQTGADRAGLDAARADGIETGGTAPKGWRTEDGSDPSLEELGLIESMIVDYGARTSKNAADSDCTLIFSANPTSPGTLKTISSCKAARKPYVLIDPFSSSSHVRTNAVGQAQMFICKQWREKGPLTVNVAGNRESSFPGIYDTVVDIMKRTVSYCRMVELNLMSLDLKTLHRVEKAAGFYSDNSSQSLIMGWVREQIRTLEEIESHGWREKKSVS